MTHSKSIHLIKNAIETLNSILKRAETPRACAVLSCDFSCPLPPPSPLPLSKIVVGAMTMGSATARARPLFSLRWADSDALLLSFLPLSASLLDPPYGDLSGRSLIGNRMPPPTLHVALTYPPPTQEEIWLIGKWQCLSLVPCQKVVLSLSCTLHLTLAQTVKISQTLLLLQLLPSAV